MPKTKDGGFLLDEGNPTPYGNENGELDKKESEKSKDDKEK